MKRIGIALLLIAFCAGRALSEPILASDPSGNNTEFFIMSVDGEELQPSHALEKYNWVFFKDLAELGLFDGWHEVKLRSCNESEESEDLIFFLDVQTFENFRRFEIVPDPDNNDPEYLYKFDPDFAVAEIADGQVIIKPRPPDN